MIDGLLVAEESAVGDEEAYFAVTEKILLGKPGGQLDVGRKVWDPVFVFPLPEDALTQSAESGDHDVSRVARNVRAAHDRAEAHVDETGVARAVDELLQVL